MPDRPAPGAPSRRRSPCPIASALDIIGDTWTLLVVRDLLWFGKRRFAELLRSSESVSTNILADRLERLTREGVITRRQYQDRPPRYEYVLTEKGRDLEPVLRELVRWGSRHVEGTFKPPPEF